ncbi:uncharacterized protein [Mycetomoellerius zeteki]|uniref:uncharacterized protein n=1 Tax=Mycetomoellerius zeteki TaxID=64791 RepID=UPI00084E3E1A|nr:PREDICTED: uncharacterized protein LOC108729404 [Trachymyrmex zeteki]
MLASLLKNKEIVIRCLEMNKRYDAIPTDDEWRNIEDIANCLISIKTATEILSGVQYPTVNLALLFRAEIESSMCINENDSFIIIEFKETILRNLAKRFPIHETHVCGALLDPTLQNIKGVAEYLADKQQSPEEFLMYMIHKMIPFNIRNNEQVSKEADTHFNNKSCSLPGIKKLRLELAAKHKYFLLKIPFLLKLRNIYTYQNPSRILYNGGIK